MKRLVCGIMYFAVLYAAPGVIGGTLIVDLESEWLEAESDENGNTIVTISIDDFAGIEGKRIDSAYLYVEVSAVADPEEGLPSQHVTLAIVEEGGGGEGTDEMVRAEYTLGAAQTHTAIFDLTQVYRNWARQDVETSSLYLKCIDPQDGAEIVLSPNANGAAGWLELRYSNRDD